MTQGLRLPQTHRGIINVDANKLYEFTGYIKSANIETEPKLAKGEMFYYGVNEGKTAKIVNFFATPWAEKSGDQEWTQFTVPAIWTNWNGYDGMTIDPRVEFQVPDAENPEFYIANLHLHEVSFETVDFRLTEKMENPKTYDKFQTAFTPLTSTGNEIISGDEKQKITAKYSSTNETVARVSEDGVITVVSDGECEILAEVTINDVTRVGRIPIAVSGLEVMFERVEVTHPESLKAGEIADTEIKYINTDGSEYVGEGVNTYYESKTPEVAMIDQNGKITAKNPGKAEFSVVANVGTYNTRKDFAIEIEDDTPLASVEIDGVESVE